MSTLSQQLKCILLQIHQYKIYIIYKPGPELYIADWLSGPNCAENTDEEIAGMKIGIISIIITTVIPTHMKTKDIQAAIQDATHLQDLKSHTTEGLPLNRDAGIM